MLPAGLRRLCIRTCEELELLPDVLPVHLTDLECSGSWEILEVGCICCVSYRMLKQHNKACDHLYSGQSPCPMHRSPCAQEFLLVT